MKPSLICSPAMDGFQGCLYKSAKNTGKCIIVLLGQDGRDFMSRAAARWLTSYQDCSALCLALRQDPSQDPGISLWNLNTVSQAVSWLHSRDYPKVGILGMSMQAVIALSAAARIPEISLTLAFSPCDYVPWGFRRGMVGNCKNAEYPTGKSLLTFKSQPLPFQEAAMEKEEYWNLFKSQSRKHLEPHSIAVFDRCEAVHPVPREAFIPVENIRGAVILVGAEDDSMWNSTRYIYRMRKRLREKEFIFPLKTFTYSHGTHLLLPQRMVMDALPVIGGMTAFLYASGRRHPGKCRAARISLDRKLSSYLQSW